MSRKINVSLTAFMERSTRFETKRRKNKDLSVQVRIHASQWIYFGQERELSDC